MKTYDQINKVKEKYEGIIKDKDAEILKLSNKLEKVEKQNDELRKKLYDAGEGKGQAHHLKDQLNDQIRQNKTLENKLKNLDGSKLIASFTPERQQLIRNIQKLSYNNNIFNRLAYKFKDGLENVIEIAYRIKNNYVADMDYFTFVFRDDIVGLLEKMFKVILGKHEDSASKYLVKLSSGVYSLPKEYYQRIPKLKEKEVLLNILFLLNIQSTGYHGTKTSQKRLFLDAETNEMLKPDRFLNLSSSKQLEAIFTLLQFMYDVFTNPNHEAILLSISSSWFMTI